MRNTIVVHGRLAMRGTRLRLSRKGQVGTQVLAIEHVAARLAGGFVKVVDVASLRAAVTSLIDDVDLGELEPIKRLPGFPYAAAASLMKLWMSGLDLGTVASHPRIAAILTLDAAVRKALPPGIRPHDEVVVAARSRVLHAPAVLGTVRIEGMTELHPIWRSLLIDVSEHVEVTWDAGPRDIPEWLSGTRIEVITKAPAVSRLTSVSCATARHEVIEAFRWARSLLVLGIPAADIAIATASTKDYDDHFAALARDAGINIHFVHGLTAVHTAEGQGAAALADVLLRGLSQKRVRRLIDLIRTEAPPLSSLPEDWDAVLPPDAALTTVGRWKKAFERHHRGAAISPVLMPILELLSHGPSVAEVAGELLLSGQSLAVWRRALVDGPATALDQTIQGLRIDDGVDPYSSLAYMSAESLATMPRKHVRLIGLTSRSWPRGISEDALIPSHVIATRDLDPLPMTEEDRRDFSTILATTSGSITLSWARRDADGRALGVSSLVPEHLAKGATHLRRVRRPHHAMSEADRLLARPEEFALTDRAESALSCWFDWHDESVTAHDGLIRIGHPRIKSALKQYHSTTSLRMLLRDPLGFVWQYALGFYAPEFDDEPLILDPRHFGNILHDVLRRTVNSLEAEGGLAGKTPDRIRKAIDFSAYDAGVNFKITQPVPPKLIWHATMDEIVSMAEASLLHRMPSLPGQVSYTEVAFGGGHEPVYGRTPWDAERHVKVPGTDVKIRGYIDRLDLSETGQIARVMDYKSGKVPKNLNSIILNGGSELQRCLYGFAVRALLGDDVSIESGLLYPRGEAYAPLPAADDVLESLAAYVKEAVDGLLAGNALPGIEAHSRYNDLKFALPANAAATYLKRKSIAVNAALGAVTEIWEAA